jgi:hypothetical protein
LPRFVIVQRPGTPPSPIDFADFVGITKGLSISSAAASASGSRGPDFLELGLSQTFNLRVQASGDSLVISLISTLNPGEFSPVRLEIIGRDEVVTAELLQRRLHYLRQVYATALLLEDGRESDLVGVLRDDPRADLEYDLVAEEDKLVIRDAGSGSLILSLVAKTKAAYRALLYTCSVPFAEGRKALLGRVVAGTALAELEVQAKAQDLRLKGAHGVLDLAKKIDTIKDKDTRELIRQRLLGDMAGLTSTEAPFPKPLALEHSRALETSFDPIHARPRAQPVERPKGPGIERRRQKKR